MEEIPPPVSHASYRCNPVQGPVQTLIISMSGTRINSAQCAFGIPNRDQHEMGPVTATLHRLFAEDCQVEGCERVGVAFETFVCS